MPEVNLWFFGETGCETWLFFSFGHDSYKEVVHITPYIDRDGLFDDPSVLMTQPNVNSSHISHEIGFFMVLFFPRFFFLLLLVCH